MSLDPDSLGGDSARIRGLYLITELPQILRNYLMNSTVTTYQPILYDDNPHELNSTLRSPGLVVTDTYLIS